MNMLLQWGVTIALLLSSNLGAATLSGVTEEALSKGTHIEIVRQKIAMGNADVSIARSLPNPVLGYGWYGESVETKVGPQEQKFSITQKIPWLGKLKDQVDVAEVEVDKQRIELQAMQASVVYQVRIIWSEICYLTKAREINKKTHALYKNWLEKLRSDYESMRTSYSRVIKMETEVTVLQEDIFTIERKLADQYTRLGIFLNRKMLSESFSDSLAMYAKLAGNKVLDSALSISPQLQENQLQREIWIEREELSKGGYFPDLAVGATYIQTGEAVGMAGSGKDPWMLTVGISLPLNILQTNARVQKAQLGTQQATIRIQETRNSLDALLQTTQNLITEAQRIQSLYTDRVVPDIEKSIRVQENQFAVGNIDFMQLLDDYRMLLKLQLRIHQALKTEFQSKAKVLWIGGDSTTAFNYPYMVVNKEIP
ncbi:MAG: TolC family protein [Fibrobacterales bacterium]